MTKEWLLSSALLLAALIALRAILGKRMRPGFRCALWLLALLRLLLPVTLFHTNLSGTELLRQTVGPLVTAEERYETTQKPVYAGTMTDTPLSVEAAEEQHGGEVYKVQGYPSDGEKADLHTYFFRDTPESILARLLPKLWLAGVCITAAVFLLENLALALRLRKRRTRLQVECPLPVYAAEGLDSSCLFGWTVYVSPDTAADPEKLRHVLAHERSHFRHGDGFWALCRAAALALHWFDPLAWWAAALSRQDSELWADAGAVRSLGAGEWEAYGETLIALAAGKKKAGLLSAATAMSGGKKALRERVRMIARKGKLPLWITVLALTLAIIAALCAFAGKRASEEPVILTGARYGNLSELYRDDHAGTLEKSPCTLTIRNAEREGTKLTLDCTLKAEGEKKEKFTFTVELMEGRLSDGRRVLVGYESFVSGPHSVSEFILTEETAADEICFDHDLPARFILHLRGLDGWCSFDAPLPEIFRPCLEGDYPDDASTDRIAAAEKALGRVAKPLYSLTIAGSEGGSFPAGYAALITGEYAEGEEILLTVRPDPGWRFDHWELSAGQVEDEHSGDTVFTMPDSDAELKPVFAPSNRVTVTVSVTEGGKASVTHTDDAGNESWYGVYSGTSIYFMEGEALTLIAEPDAGWRFVCWDNEKGHKLFADMFSDVTEYTVPAGGEAVRARFEPDDGAEAVEPPAPVEETDAYANPAAGDTILTAAAAAMRNVPNGNETLWEIPAGTLLTVVAAEDADGECWLVVQGFDLKLPGYVTGWLRERDTRPYDDSLRDEVTNPVCVPTGATVFRLTESGSREDTLTLDGYGTIVRREDGWLRLTLVGGAEVWAAEADVQVGKFPTGAAAESAGAWLRWAGDLYADEAPEVLSEAELQSWTDWFNEDYHRMGFLTSTYMNPLEINLDELLYIGIGHTPTQEEVRAYLAHTGYWVTECPTDVLPRNELLAYLRTYTGVDFGDLTLSYSYVPESDCWYHAHGDTNVGGVMLSGGVKHGDEVLLFYDEGSRCVTLDVSGETPRFRKNVVCEWDSAGRAVQTVSARAGASEARVLTGLAPVFTPEPIQYGSAKKAVAALESLTSMVNGKEVPIEIVPDCGAGYNSGGAWERWPVSGGDPVYGEFRDGEDAVGALYFVYEDGRVLSLPMPGTAEGPCRMKYSAETDEPGTFYLFGEGDLVVWNCVMPEAVLLPDETGEGYTSVIYTLFVPTGEVFLRSKR